MKLFRGKEKVTKETSVSRAISMAPLARQIIQRHGIKFIGKDVSPLESIEKTGMANGLDEHGIDIIVKEINSSISREVAGTGTITLTLPAAAKLKELIKQKGKKGVRLRLVSSGCSIYTYDMDFGTKAVGDEVKIESNGVAFFVEKKVLSLLDGTEISFDSGKEGFVFKNPNIKDGDYIHLGP